MKPEKYELDINNYPFTVDIDTRFGDTDTLRHVNNVAIARLFEESRVKFGLFSKNKTFEEMPVFGKVVTVSVAITYLREVFYPDPVTVAVGVADVGRSSHTLSCLMLQKGVPVAHCKTVLVQFDDGQSTPIPAEVLEILNRFMIDTQ